MRRVLILDDDKLAAELLAEAIKALGLEAVVTHHPEEALTRVEKEKFDLILLDLFLPGMDGLEVARRIRKLKGPALPLLAVSGVLKGPTITRDLQEVGARLIRKPVDLALLEAAVRRSLGLEAATSRSRSQGQDPASRGFQVDLARHPVYRVYRKLYETRASGTLEVTQNRIRRRLTFHMGQIRKASTNLLQETAAGLLHARGRVDRATLDAAVAAARTARVPVTEVLVREGHVTRTEAARAAADQVREVAAAAVGAARGQATFTPEAESGADPSPHRVHPLEATVAGVRRFWTTDGLAGWLGGQGAARLKPTPAMEREAYVLRGTTPGETVWRRIDGRRRLSELLEATRPEDLPLLFTLVATGLATLEGGAPAAAREEAAPPEATPPSRGDGDRPDDDPRLTEADRAARRRIATETARLAEASHYQALEVPANADVETIQGAYIAKAQAWHSDRFAGLDLGARAREVSAIFQRFGEARATLTQADARKEYDIFLDRKAKGLPTDVGAILKAEDVFKVGEQLMRRGKPAEALPRFEEALRLNHAEPEFRAWHAYARFQVEGPPAAPTARQALLEALEDQPGMVIAAYFLGRIAAGTGDRDEAARRFRQVLEADPQHAEARQQLAELGKGQHGEGDKAAKGLLGRILKR